MLEELYFLLDACLYHPVLTRSVTGTRHVAFKYKWRFNFVELLEQPLVLKNVYKLRLVSPVSLTFKPNRIKITNNNCRLYRYLLI